MLSGVGTKLVRSTVGKRGINECMRAVADEEDGPKDIATT